MIRVWFNHWFSTSYRLIELMKEDKEEQIYVIGSNQQKDSVIQNVCEEWYEEPYLKGEDYILFCLDFCMEHKIDVFVPRRQMVEISQNKGRFLELGVKVMVDDDSTIHILNDKAATYEYFKDCSELHIPDYYIVNNVTEFESAYHDLRKDYNQVCTKFVKDEGGMSFRKVVENVDRFQRLAIYPGTEIEYEVLRDTLKEKEEFHDLMVMPYLPEHEISVDCLDTRDGLIAVTRVKGSTRQERVVYDEQILNMVRIIMNKVKLQYPCNIQFKLKDHIPYLLEINTRMSGGLQMSCLAADVNIPNIALNKVLGKDISWTMKRQETIVSYIEIPQIIN